jgi:predicted RNA-binding protein
MIKDGSEDLVMESVTYIRPQSDGVLIKSLFGEEKVLDARLVEMNLAAQKILLESV